MFGVGRAGFACAVALALVVTTRGSAFGGSLHPTAGLATPRVLGVVAGDLPQEFAATPTRAAWIDFFIDCKERIRRVHIFSFAAAVNSARDAEVLLRWRQAVRAAEATPGVDLDSLSEAKLELLYAGLVRLATVAETALAALVDHMLAGDEPASRS